VLAFNSHLIFPFTCNTPTGDCFLILLGFFFYLSNGTFPLSRVPKFYINYARSSTTQVLRPFRASPNPPPFFFEDKTIGERSRYRLTSDNPKTSHSNQPSLCNICFTCPEPCAFTFYSTFSSCVYATSTTLFEVCTPSNFFPTFCLSAMVLQIPIPLVPSCLEFCFFLSQISLGFFKTQCQFFP